VAAHETTRPGEATELARQAVRRGANVVIAAGGDGTVSEVANGLVYTDTALGVLPVGTTNAWALQMGIPTLNPWSPTAPVVKLAANIEEKSLCLPFLIIFSGFYYMSAGGNVERVKTAQRTILYTLIGLSIVLLARGIVYVINNIITIRMMRYSGVVLFYKISICA
jgi:preprotein translocase subunit YajC